MVESTEGCGRIGYVCGQSWLRFMVKLVNGWLDQWAHMHTFGHTVTNTPATVTVIISALISFWILTHVDMADPSVFLQVFSPPPCACWMHTCLCIEVNFTPILKMCPCASGISAGEKCFSMHFIRYFYTLTCMYMHTDIFHPWPLNDCWISYSLLWTFVSATQH